MKQLSIFMGYSIDSISTFRKKFTINMPSQQMGNTTKVPNTEFLWTPPHLDSQSSSSSTRGWNLDGRTIARACEWRGKISTYPLCQIPRILVSENRQTTWPNNNIAHFLHRTPFLFTDETCNCSTSVTNFQRVVYNVFNTNICGLFFIIV